MKKQGISLFILVTLLFLAFTIGLFVGRNQRGDALVVNVPPVMQTLSPAEDTALEESIPATEAICFPIDINTAGKEEFMALPGIGEVLAQRILAYRELHGRFETVESLMNVEGIGEKRMEDIWDLIAIGGSE